MSVNMNDKYLDELLDAIEPIIAPKEEPIVEQVQPEPELSEDISLNGMLLEEMDSSENLSIMDLFNAGEEENTDSLGSSYEVLDEGDSDIGDLLASLASEDGDSSNGMSEDDISALLDAASSAAESSSNDNLDQDADVKELLKQFTDDEDLSDIQEILDKNDNMEAVDESILEIPEVGLFQLEENMENDSTEETTNTKKGLFSFLKKKDKEEKDTEDTQEDGKRKKKEKKKKEKKKKKVKEDAAEVAEVADQEAVLENSVENAEPMELLDDAEELSIGLEELVDVDGMSDIEQLLTGGAFDVQGELETVSEESGDKKGKDTKKKEKKESLFAKVYAMLTEEDEDEIPEAKATGITDENKSILEELSKEDKKKAKKEKKEKKKKDKNAKNQKEGEEDLEEDNKKVKKKKEKKKKEKKVKTRKVVEIDTDKKLSRKRVMSIFALCFSILAAIIILQKATLVTSNLKETVWAYDNNDYTTCYQNLLGVDRNEKEEEIFQKSAIIMSVQRKLDSYQHFMMMGLEVEALNSLLEGVVVYREQQDAAREWDVTTQITEIYQVICDKLSVFGVSDEDVEEILGYDSKVTYTKRLDSIVNGTPFVVEEPVFEEDSSVEEAKPLEDVLPWEEDFLPEDTREVSMQSESVQDTFSNENTDTMEVPMESDSQGQTVVVGSSPVAVSETGTVVTGGQNVGSGNTNVSVELNNGNAVVSGF